MDLSQIKDIYDSVGGADGIKKGVSSVSGLFSQRKNRSEKTAEASKKEALPGASAPDSGYSPELERLIALVIEDGKIADDEMHMLSARAEKEGVDPFEFQLVIKRRLRRKKEEAELLKNPVKAMAEAFKMAEAAAQGEKSAINGGALSSALALIPGVGQAAAVGGLAASLIKTPSNLNSLKAEIISHAIIPEEEMYLADFMTFCHTQRELEMERQHARSISVSGVLSSVTVGRAVDLIPIWTTKLNQLIVRARTLYPQSDLIRNTISMVYESPAARLRKEKARNPIAFMKELDGLTAPEDNSELLEVIAFLYEISQEDELAKEKHKNFYNIAERRFTGNEHLLQQLKAYKIKKFGLF